MICRKKMMEKSMKEYKNMLSYKLPYGGIIDTPEYKSYVNCKEVYEKLGCSCADCKPKKEPKSPKEGK